MNEIIISYIKNMVLESSNLKLSESENLLDGGVLDSLGMMRLVLYLEKKYDKRVPPEDLNIANFETVEKITRYFSTK